MKNVRKDDQNDLYHVKCLPDKGVVSTPTPVRSIGRWVESTVSRSPASEAERDLVGDTFFSLYQPNPQIRPDVPTDRLINSKLIEWMKDAPGYEEARGSTIGGVLESATASGLMWTTLTSDATVQKVLEKQRQAEEAQKEAERAAQEQIQAAQDGDQDALDQAKAKADAARARAKAAAEAGAKFIDTFKDSPLGQGMMQKALKEGKDAADEAREMAGGWGSEPGSLTEIDTQSILKYVQANDQKLKEIARLAGRLRGISTKAVESAQQTYTGVVTEPAYTKNPLKLFPTERIYLGQSAPPLIRTQKMLSLVSGGGLLGWRSLSEGKVEGAFIAYVDESGSMEGTKEIVAKALALGVAFALHSTEDVKVERTYEITSFAARQGSFRTVRSDQDLKAHIDWASGLDGGGTDFDMAFLRAIGDFKRFKNAGVQGADLLFITDGQCRMSQSVRDAWIETARETGARLIYIQVGTAKVADEMAELASMIITVKDGSDFEGQAEALAMKITEDIVGAGERMLEGGD